MKIYTITGNEGDLILATSKKSKAMEESAGYIQNGFDLSMYSDAVKHAVNIMKKYNKLVCWVKGETDLQVKIQVFEE